VHVYIFCVIHQRGKRYFTYDLIVMRYEFSFTVTELYPEDMHNRIVTASRIVLNLMKITHS